MDLQLEGVIVTAGGSNIGRAISLAFAREGAALVIADVQAGNIASEALNLGAKKR